MTNNVVTFNFNGVQVLIDVNTKLKRFTLPLATAVTKTVYDSSDGSQYKVPTGKKLTIIYTEALYLYALNSLCYADDLNGVTNKVIISQPAVDTYFTNKIFLYHSVPADKYLNFEHNYDTAVVNWVIYGIEEDA